MEYPRSSSGWKLLLTAKSAFLFRRPRVNELMMIPDGFRLCLLPPLPVPPGSQMVAGDEVKF